MVLAIRAALILGFLAAASYAEDDMEHKDEHIVVQQGAGMSVASENVTTVEMTANLRGTNNADNVEELDGFIRYDGKNCYDGRGAINIDFSPRTMSPYACGQWCIQTSLCDCIVWKRKASGHTHGKCWRRSDCQLSQCEAKRNFYVYQRFR